MPEYYIRFVALEKKFQEKEQIRKNEHCLVVGGLPETEIDAGLTDYLNDELLPILEVPKWLNVVHSFRMGKQHNDVSPHLCKLIFDTDVTRDAVKSAAFNLKDLSDFKKVRIRPSLSPSQQTMKKNIEKWKDTVYPKGPDGRSPVRIRFEGDGTPYASNVHLKSRIEVPAADMFEASGTSLFGGRGTQSNSASNGCF